MSNSTGSTIESRTDFKDTPEGQYQYWQAELAGAHKTLGPWKKQADKIVTRYVDAKKKSEREDSDTFQAQSIPQQHNNSQFNALWQSAESRCVAPISRFRR